MNNISGFGGRDTRISGLLEDLPLGIISFNADGIIDFINPAFIKMGILFNLKISSLTGKNIFEDEIIPGVSLSEEIAELKKGYPFEKEIKQIKSNGTSEISLIIKSSPYYEDNNFAGGILVLEDLKVISESREEDAFKIESFRNITSEITDLFFIVDNTGRIICSSGSKLSYFSSENLYYSDIKELIPGLPHDFKDILTEAHSRSRDEKFIVTLKLNNTTSHYECIIKPLSVSHKKYLSCTFINIDDKIKSKDLEYRLNHYKIIADVISDGIIGVNSEGIINFWSQAVFSLTGFYEDETTGNPIWNYLPELNQKSFLQLREDLIQVQLFKREILILDKNGNRKTINASFFSGDEDNIFISLNAVPREIKQPESKNIDLHFLNLILKTNTIILKLSNTGIIDYLNPAFTKQLNFREDEVSGKNLNDFLSSESNLEFESQGETLYKDLIVKNKRGEKIFFYGSFTPFYENEILTGFNVYLINQSDKKKEDQNLRLFQLLFENTNEGMAVENRGKIIAANNSFGKLFGYQSAEEMKGRDILDLAASNDVLKVAEYLQLYHAGKELSQRFEFSGKRRDGSIFSCELTPSSFRVEESIFFVLTIRDITEKNRVQQIICESEEKYRNLIENIDDFLFTLERSKLFFKPVFFTNPVEKITGYTQTEMLKDIKLLLKIIHPDDLNSMKDSLKRFSRNRSKMSSEFEFRIISRQGNVVWVRNKLSVVRNERGEVEKIYGLVSDISLRRKAEEDLQKTTQNLLKLNETKDRFISIISHDLRTPFSSILGFTDLLLNDETLTGEERDQYVKYIQESSNAMLSLVNSLLDWTRLQTGRIRFEPERADASEVILKSINVLGGAAFQKNISVTSIVQENLYLYIDKELIGQVFNNLISNAIKFTNESGKITISASPLQVSRFYEFSVKDTGVGIKPDDAKKLFGVDTKYTTEGTAGEKGTGLGLSLVKEIIEKHGGTIRIESEPGSGTNLLFTLPVAAANILLIDSNITDRILYSKIIKHITSEYNIDTASNGREALNKISSSTYALVVTEHTMPVMGGYDFVLELKKLDMKVKPPVIVLSNSIDRHTIEDYNEIGVKQVFQKPVNLSLFKQSVEKTLHQGLK